jgi:uncharacterized protein (DUF4415 family)
MYQTIRTRSGREIILPTPEEDAAITAAAMTDPDNPPLTDEELVLFRPMRGRPTMEVKRPMVSLRMDPDLLAHLRASGKGWQTKVNAILREAVERGRV